MLAALLCVGNAGAQPYSIDRFDVAIDLSKDGSMIVEERISTTFHIARRGIFRFIPVHYDDGRGKTRSIFIGGISVSDDSGTPQTTKITHEGQNLKIRVGDENVFFPPGARKTYLIRYRVEAMLNWFEDRTDWNPYAELYWNANGDQWDTDIGRLSVAVRFPKGSSSGLRAKVFFGPYGSYASDLIAETASEAQGPNTGTRLSLTDGGFSCVRRAVTPAYSGLTVVLALPSGSIDRPSVLQQAKWLILPNLGFTIPVWVLLAFAAFWLRYGRDPSGGAIAVQFDPPDGLSGPEAGTMIDERVDQRDIVAGIFGLAVKGFLRMIPTEEGLVFKRRGADLALTGKGDESKLAPFESKLLGKLRKCGELISTADLRTHVAPALGELRGSLYQGLVGHGFYKANPESVRVGWTVGGLAVVGALAFVFIAVSPFGSIMPSVVGGIVAAVIVVIFARGMPKRTASGAKARDRVLGFHEFVRRARGNEFEWMSKKQPDMALFEEFLPHAVAFGLVQEWSGAFEGHLKEMPDWYGAPPGTPFRPVYFASDIGDISSSLAAAAATPPRSAGASGGSSGFGGGGFSGGGFGGGGGGSW